MNPVANAGAPIVPHIPAPLLRRASSCQVRSRSSIATWSDWPCGPPCTSIIAGTDPSRGLQRRSAALPLISGAFDQRSVPEDGQAPNSTVHLMSTFDPKRTLRLTTSCSPEQTISRQAGALTAALFDVSRLILKQSQDVRTASGIPSSVAGRGTAWLGGIPEPGRLFTTTRFLNCTGRGKVSIRTGQR